MTAIGSGAAMSRTKSHSPRSHTASISVSHRRPIDASLSFTRLRVKPALTSLRRNRCAGSSISIIIRHARLVGPDAAGVGEQLGIALGLDHRRYVAAAARPLRSRNTGSFSRIHL